MSDEQILLKSIKCPKAFGLLVDRYQGPLMARATRLLGSREAAEDAVQETFIKIYTKAHQFVKNEGKDDSFRAWAYTILVRHCFSMLREEERERVQFAPLEPGLEGVIADPKADVWERVSLQDEVSSVLSRLPATFRRVLEAYFFNGASEQEIAAEEGVSIGAIRVRMHRAKKEFKKIKLLLTP
ncbi:MAG: RNA polymerase sigma factor [Candidatus Vogelbacteria bacterium]|nr:RNA polymerase sigma factor [Candidatus Vogelbacteria bacterium]